MVDAGGGDGAGEHVHVSSGALGVALEMAEKAILAVGVDPVQAARLATEALTRARARRAPDPLAVSTARRALGLAARNIGDLSAAVAHLRAAARTAEIAGLRPAAGAARLSLAGALMLRGDHGGARRELGRAGESLKGDSLLDVTGQLGVLAYIEGRWDEALAHFDAAVAGYRRAGIVLDEAWALKNRGGAHLHTGHLRAAEADLNRATEIYERDGQSWEVADVALNLGCVATRRGDIPLAMARFDRAEALFRAQGHLPAQALFDRCEALLAARLLPEARRAAEQAVAQLGAARAGSNLAYARLFLSEAALLGDDLATAKDEARRARNAFAGQASASWAAVARLAAIRAAHAEGRADARLLSSAQAAVVDLDAAGFVVAALDARLLGARIALALGRHAEARAQLDAARAQRVGTVGARARAWHAEALLRLTDGDRGGAQAALRAGLAMLDRYRATLGATELRAQASGWGTDLARLGLSMAIEDGRADAVLVWAERFRATALATRPRPPTGDDALGTALAELRAVVADVEESAREGQPATALLRRQRRLEEAVRALSRQARGGAERATGVAIDPRALVGVLGPRCLVELIEHGGRLYAVVVHGPSRPARRLVDLGPAATFELEVDAARFALRRLVAGRRTPAGTAAAVRALDHANARLDAQLLAPLDLDSACPLVVVPTGALHRLAWSLLPSCAGRSVEVAPSAALWAKASTSAAVPDARGDEAGNEAGHAVGNAVVLVAGPGLPGAAGEVRALQQAYPEARCLSDDEATVEAVAAALDGAATAHVAAHGTFRSDNPMMSSLRLADGPLTVYDLERLRRPPARLVLSACDAAVSDVRVGDELMGVAAALLGLGTTSVVAAVMAVPDEATRVFMLDFHACLRKGMGPAEALNRAQDDAPDRHTVAAFVCLGAG